MKRLLTQDEEIRKFRYLFYKEVWYRGYRQMLYIKSLITSTHVIKSFPLISAPLYIKITNG